MKNCIRTWMGLFPVIISSIVFQLCPAAYAQSGNDGFSPNADDIVWALAVQADGKLLVGGDFLHIGGLSQAFLARLNADGSLDTSFTPTLDSSVYGIAVQGDGKIVVAGL